MGALVLDLYSCLGGVASPLWRLGGGGSDAERHLRHRAHWALSYDRDLCASWCISMMNSLVVEVGPRDGSERAASAVGLRGV